jgi:hypothetical protein
MGTTMTNPYSIPTTLDDWNLTVSLADYQKTLVDNIYNANVLLSQLKAKRNVIDGGNSIVSLLLKEEQNDGGFYLGADVLNNAQGNYVTQCEYKWQNIYEPIVITRDEERQNSGAAHKIVDLVASKTMSSEKAIAKRVEQALSTPVSGAGNLVDLETLVNTGTLGSVAGGTYSFWQSTVTASGAFATQGLADMTTATYAVSSAANEDNPTMYLTNKTIFQKFEATRLPLERIQNGDMSANAGFKNLTFKGVPVVYGNYIGSGLLFGLNMNYIDWNVDSATDFVTTEFLKPTNQTVKVAYILLRANMTTNNRRRHFKLTGIS